MTAAARIGWIGLGRIGSPMAERVLAAGHALAVWARRPEAAAGLVARGAHGCADASELARGSDIVCTIVTGPDDVQRLHEALMPQARPGTLFIDLSTATPGTAAGAAGGAERHGHAVLDAPVTGGVAGAMRGTLTAFVGGDAAARSRARPLLEAFCQRLVPCGGAGSGYRAKLINQTLVAGVLMGLADGARVARAAGLDAAQLLPALSGGTAGSFLLESYLPRMMSADGEGPVTFTLALLLKDLQLARGEAASLGLPVPLLEAAIAAVRLAIQRHGAEAGVQRLAS